MTDLPITTWLIKYLVFCLLLLISFPSIAIALPRDYSEQSVYYKPVLVDHPVKPLPPEVPLSIRSNCYAYAESVVGDLPPMKTLQQSAGKAWGQLAVFDYNGLPHVAVTIKQGYGTFTVKESNYKAGTISTREVSFTDPHLLGFYTKKELPK